MTAPSPNMVRHGATQDSANIALFGTLASDWWDPDGASGLLHRINPARMEYVRDAVACHFGLVRNRRWALKGLLALDVGCGAGLVAEPLARMGAEVDGLDAGEAVIAVAKEHAAGQGLPIRYHVGEVAEFAALHAAKYDFITCLEVVEHVTDIEGFLSSIARLLKPGGLLVFSTPNRTAASWAVLIAGAERLLKLIPDGGHAWSQFVTPDEMTQKLADASMRVNEIKGLTWSPSRGFHISSDTRINYIGTASRV